MVVESREEETDGRREGTRTHRELRSASFRGFLVQALREELKDELSNQPQRQESQLSSGITQGNRNENEGRHFSRGKRPMTRIRLGREE
jgi:hypothetical protein